MLTINGGSSSVKFALFEPTTPRRRRLAGRIERIGLDDAALVLESGERRAVKAPDHAAALAIVLDLLEDRGALADVAAAGHRIVHGGARHRDGTRVDAALRADLGQLSLLDPDHLPGELAMIEALQQRCPNLPQFACFDTAFHASMPRAAQLLPIARRFEAKGLRRYGFHGLSYEYLLRELVSVMTHDWLMETQPSVLSLKMLVGFESRTVSPIEGGCQGA